MKCTAAYQPNSHLDIDGHENVPAGQAHVAFSTESAVHILFIAIILSRWLK